MIIFGYVMRTVQNTIIFFSLAYFGGIIWLYWCHISLNDVNRRHHDDPARDIDSNFLLAYDLDYTQVSDE